MTVNIILNGQPIQLDDSVANLTQLVSELGFMPDRIAIEHNGVIVPRRQWPETRISPADHVELVQFVGGGAPTTFRSNLSQRSP